MELVDPVFISQGAFGRLRELKALLAESSIASEIVVPPGCSSND